MNKQLHHLLGNLLEIQWRLQLENLQYKMSICRHLLLLQQLLLQPQQLCKLVVNSILSKGIETNIFEMVYVEKPQQTKDTFIQAQVGPIHICLRSLGI